MNLKNFFVIAMGMWAVSSLGDCTDVGPLDFVWCTVLGKTYQVMDAEVTQMQWETVMGSNPSYFKGGNFPVETVSYSDVTDFIRKINQHEAGSGYTYRLPTEDEWEYVARAGTKKYYYWGDDVSLASTYAWSADNSGNKTHEVRQLLPNAWGLYDISGNVDEFTSTTYSSYYRIIRGGDWQSDTYYLRAGYRDEVYSNEKSETLGLRLVRSN